MKLLKPVLSKEVDLSMASVFLIISSARAFTILSELTQTFEPTTKIKENAYLKNYKKIQCRNLYAADDKKMGEKLK